MKTRDNTKARRWWSRVVIAGVVVSTAVALTVSTIAGAAPDDKTLTFSGDLVGSTQGLPIDTNDNFHMATITKSMNQDWFVESYGETDQLPAGDPERTCTLPNGAPGVLSRLVPGGGQQVWNYPKTNSQLWVQTSVRELCSGAGGISSFFEESDIIGGWGEFQGATGKITVTNRAGADAVFRVLTGGQPIFNKTVPPVPYVFVTTTTHFEMQVTISKDKTNPPGEADFPTG